MNNWIAATKAVQSRALWLLKVKKSVREMKADVEKNTVLMQKCIWKLLAAQHFDISHKVCKY